MISAPSLEKSPPSGGGEALSDIAVGTAPGSVRERLRAATAVAHQRLEEVMALDERCRDREGYRALLERLLGIYVPLEAALTRIDWSRTSIGPDRLAKAEWLRADLHFLGLAPARIGELPLAGALPEIRGVAQGLGVLYVLEGATLGGQLTLRRLEPALGVTASAGARFFASWGREVGPRWRAFVAELERYGRVPADVERMERAAIATFACFEAWLDRLSAMTTLLGGSAHGG